MKGKKILLQIQEKRDKMIDTAKNKGFTSEDTIRCSQELDELIYEYQRSLHLNKKQKVNVHFPIRKMVFAVHNQLDITKQEMYT
ncbi:aspartyl-phosphate phosphatase Spo0E family protein [Bacillus sp. FJAT-49705]|uniref:Aspartyl-phosphate phosphatase Spo0E family protein n=1 Tax=Cytobacillus citreus TaxID=2833586 RepID=A0ABS5NMJ0_9BACI|nr:aspartyl-phosphate phosphatase Spo0E family protein [Cytobacillus citreus]